LEVGREAMNISLESDVGYETFTEASEFNRYAKDYIHGYVLVLYRVGGTCWERQTQPLSLLL
jgi:hypothetical protein